VSRAPLRSTPGAKLRRGRRRDLEPLLALEQTVFATDRLSRRSLRHFLAAPNATLLVAEVEKEIAAYALVLYPRRSKLARLYSIAVAPHAGRRGIGTRLLAAAEDTARRRRRATMRLEVHAGNTRAISRYEKSGYRLFGRHRDYYEDHADALRFEKPLTPRKFAPVLANKADSRRRIGFDGERHARRV
jgi:[ribosomal protein S18]-alanine N-acetyltransferase